MKPASRLSLEEIDTLLAFVRKHWPELAYYERGVVTLALNRIEAIAEKEGVSAITPERLSGQREIVEDYLLPFLEAERIRALVAAQPQNAPPSVKLTRRHFLISAASALGACFLPAAFFRRLARFPEEPAVAIDPPAAVRRTLFATIPHDDDPERWQLALGRPTTEFPAAPFWRTRFADHEGIDPDDHSAVQRRLTTHGRPPAPPGSRWLHRPVAASVWDD